MSQLPPRSADTMSDAIALSSPSGRMSKSARKAAEKRLAEALFGPNADLKGHAPDVPEWARLRRSGALLRELAARGMKPKAYIKEAQRLEAEADKAEISARS